MKILKTTPVLIVDRIEPHLPFWTEHLGYALTAQVPHGEGLGFVILERDGLEMMLQTHASVEHDIPAMAKVVRPGSTALFHEVDDVAEAQRCAGGAELLAGPRLAPYGMREIFVRDSAGFVHGFAQRV